MTPTLAELVTAPAQTVYVSGGVYLSGTLLADLPITGGAVTADARRSQTRDGSIDLSGAAAEVDALYDALVTPGAEVAIARGFVLPGGSTVAAALGRFVVDEATRKEDGAGASLSATLSDLSKRVSRARWADTYSVRSGTSLASALNAIISDRAPTIPTRITPVNTLGTLGASATFDAGAGSDPWADACGLAAAFGYALAIDVDGYAVTLPAPVLSADAAVFTFARGAAAIVTDRSRVAPLERSYNGVIVTGEGPDLDVPVRGEAWDRSPASPTYYLGPFGRVPLFYASSLITTTAQASAAAASLMAGLVGRVEQLAWSHVVHPGLKPLDVVLVEDAAGGLTPYVLDALTIPLTVDGAAGATAREIVTAY